MSDSPEQTEVSQASDQPKRNPVERLIVWGVIALAVVLIFTEGTARFGYSMTLSKLQERVQGDDGIDGKPLTVDESATLIVGYPSKTINDRVITYRYKGLIKEFGAIHLPFDDEDIILGLVTDAPPEPEPKSLVATGEDDEVIEPATSGGSPAGGGEGGGGRGSGRNFDPMQFDADSDGKISLDEAPDRMKEFFEALDTNGDGFADAEEFAARRAARQAERGAGDNDAEAGNRPQRPDANSESTPPAEESKPAEEVTPEKASEEVTTTPENSSPTKEPEPAEAAKE